MRASSVLPFALSGASIATVATACHFFNDAYGSLLSPLGPALSSSFGVPIGSIALLVAVYSLTSSVLQPLAGIWGERMDRRLMLASGPILTASGLTLMGYMPSFLLLILLVAVAGLGSAFFHPAGAAYVASYSPQNQRGLWASLFSAGGTAGMALGPLLAGPLGLKGLVWLMPVGLLVGVISYLMAPQVDSRAKRHSLEEYLVIFRGPMVTLWGMAVLRALASAAYTGLLPFILKARGFGQHEIGYSLATLAVAAAVGGVVGGRYSDKMGRVKILRSSVLLALPLYVGLVFSSPDQLWFYPLTFLVGAMVNASIPVGVVTAQEYAPKHVAVASSIMMGFSWGVAGILYWPIGILADATSPVIASLVGISLLLPSMWLALKLPEPKKIAFERQD